jgi:oligoendopeptidase F
MDAPAHEVAAELAVSDGESSLLAIAPSAIRHEPARSPHAPNAARVIGARRRIPSHHGGFMRNAIARCSALVALTLAAPAVARERSEIPAKYKWNLGDLFPSEAAWVQARDDVRKRIPRLADFRGHLGDSADALVRALDAIYAAQLALSRVTVYAQALSDEDTRTARPREMQQAADQLAVDFNAATSFVKPELLALPATTFRRFLDKDKRLAAYRFFIEDTLRWKPHTRSAPEERLIAESDSIAQGPGAAYGILKDADIPWPTVKLASGAEARIDPSAFTLHRASKVREDRDEAFDAFLGTLATYRRTMGATLYAHVRSHLFTKQARGFSSSLESALFRDNIPPAVYKQLLADVHDSLPAFHRALALRKRMLGLDVLRYQDLYVPAVAQVDMRFDPDEARAITLEALAPLGQEYVAALRKGFESGWTDYLPSTGKRAGAYSTGVYGVHPYQLLNFNGLYLDLSTLVHESGHSMHTFLSYATQPYPTSNYPIFVAEVASTLNENLLVHHMLGRAKDDATRLFLLATQLDNLRQTLFRQTQFAEFELAIHEMAERGETLTGENLSALYLKITRDYYGHDQGVCRVDDLIGSEWAMIPHFYYDFYVYQYATSMVASTSLARGLREDAARGETKRRDLYLRMLRAGGSRYPLELLRDAGVDMTTSAPFQAAIAEMSATMDEIERILGRSAQAPAPQ